jgi:Flp pilus assembly protein TadD
LEVLARDDTTVEALLELAEVRLAQGRPEEAVEPCGRVVELAPREGRSHVMLGLAYDAAGRPEDARRHLEAARRLVPLEPDVAERLERLSDTSALHPVSRIPNAP